MQLLEAHSLSNEGLDLTSSKDFRCFSVNGLEQLRQAWRKLQAKKNAKHSNCNANVLEPVAPSPTGEGDFETLRPV